MSIKERHTRSHDRELAYRSTVSLEVDSTTYATKLSSLDRNATKSLLLHLPPELRNRLYTYVLSGSIIATEFNNQSGTGIRGAYKPMLSRQAQQPRRHNTSTPTGLKLQLPAPHCQTYTEAQLLRFALNQLRRAYFALAREWANDLPAQAGATTPIGHYHC